MAGAAFFPHLPEDWEATRATLHAYAHAVGAVPRAAAVAHPKWWHISLEVRPTGLTTDPIPLPGGGSLALRMDLIAGEVVVESSDGASQRLSMADGLTGTEMGDRIIEIVSARGLQADYQRDKYENDEPRPYEAAAARTFFTAAVNATSVFARHRASLEGPVGPVQLWPHGFDLAFEWFGTRVVTHEEGGETTTHPSQINLGLYPGGRPYFYSNPWPFDVDTLTTHELPSGAQWHTEGWEGSILYYDQLAGDPEGSDKLLAYARTVHALAAPTLMA